MADVSPNMFLLWVLHRSLPHMKRTAKGLRTTKTPLRSFSGQSDPNIKGPAPPSPTHNCRKRQDPCGFSLARSRCVSECNRGTTRLEAWLLHRGELVLAARPFVSRGYSPESKRQELAGQVLKMFKGATHPAPSPASLLPSFRRSNRGPSALPQNSSPLAGKTAPGPPPRGAAGSPLRSDARRKCRLTKISTLEKVNKEVWKMDPERGNLSRKLGTTPKKQVKPSRKWWALSVPRFPW